MQTSTIPQWHPIAPDVALRLASEPEFEVRFGASCTRVDLPLDVLARMAREDVRAAR